MHGLALDSNEATDSREAFSTFLFRSFVFVIQPSAVNEDIRQAASAFALLSLPSNSFNFSSTKMESFNDFINLKCIESEVHSVLSGIVDSVVQLELLERAVAVEAELLEQEPELLKHTNTSDPMKDILDRVVEHLARSAEAEMAEFAVEFKSICTDTEDLVKLRTFSMATDMSGLVPEMKNSWTDTADLAVNLVNSGTDTDDLGHRFGLGVEMNTDPVKIVSGEYVDAWTSCNIEMKDGETCMNDVGEKLTVDIGVGTADYDAGIEGGEENRKFENSERDAVDIDLKTDGSVQLDFMEFQENLELDLDVPFYPNKTRRVTKNKKVSTTLGTGSQFLKNQPTFRRKNPPSSSTDIDNRENCIGTSNIYALKKGGKKTSSSSLDTSATAPETSIPYHPEDKENVEVGSSEARPVHPYLRLGLSKRGRALKPLHTHVQLKVEEEPDTTDADDEDEEDDD